MSTAEALREKNREKMQRWRLANREKARASGRKAAAKRRAEKYAYHVAKKREWFEANKDTINALRRERRRTDPLLALKNRLRTRTAVAFQRRGYSKTSNTRLIIGCDWAALKAHIEAQFVGGMTWENRHLWHVDHVIPLASARSEQELLKLCHFTNLQPLWAEDNIRKHDNVISLAA